MTEEEIEFVQKVWLCGTSLVVAIPRRIREVVEGDISKGDYIKLKVVGKVLRKGKPESKDKEEDLEELEEIEEEEVKEKKKRAVKKILDSDFLPEMG